MNKKLQAAIVALLLAVATQGTAANGIDYAKSKISFVSKQMNVPVEGEFRKFTARIDYDAKKPESSRAEIEVQLASVDTGSTEADTEVAKKGWFNTATFPSAKFASTSVKPAGAGKLQVSGSLSIKGLARELALPVTVKTEGGRTIFEGEFPLLRLQYRIGEGIWSDTETVADEVRVRFRIVTGK